VIVLRDIGERRRAERERARRIEEQAARAEAEATSRAKDRFLPVLSHELRTPLTPVLATVTALLDDRAAPAAVRPVFEMIRRNIEVEARLIDDLLDLTRIERGEFYLRREVIDAHDQVGRALEMCGHDAHDADVTLVSQLGAEAHHLDADPTRFQQVLWNLLKNAIKFSPPGGAVIVRSRNRADPPCPGTGGPWLVIEVIDRGIGIGPDLLPRLFTPFEQGSPSIGRRFGGLGLGLAISRTIAERHGGRLTASSEGAGQGASFALEIPTVAAPASGVPVLLPPLGAAAGHRPLRILLVEDNKDTLRYLSLMLSRRGHEVRTAGTLADALRAVAETGFELVISDIELPDGTGLELMATLGGDGDVPGIALSGFGSHEDVGRSRSAGFAEHLTKPVDFRRLEETIERVVAGNGVDGKAETSPDY
jgi:nitrogen-specific signal transduction histidine kinase/CheY-like chemotaxis protein